MNISFIVKYFGQRPGQPRVLSHSYIERWTKAGEFCPRCGKQAVWREDSDGDYYVGPQHICTACNGTFYLPVSVGNIANEQDEQRISYLKGGTDARADT